MLSSLHETAYLRSGHVRIWTQDSSGQILPLLLLLIEENLTLSGITCCKCTIWWSYKCTCSSIDRRPFPHPRKVSSCPFTSFDFFTVCAHFGVCQRDSQFLEAFMIIHGFMVFPWNVPGARESLRRRESAIKPSAHVSRKQLWGPQLRGAAPAPTSARMRTPQWDSLMNDIHHLTVTFVGPNECSVLNWHHNLCSELSCKPTPNAFLKSVSSHPLQCHLPLVALLCLPPVHCS